MRSSLILLGQLLLSVTIYGKECGGGQMHFVVTQRRALNPKKAGLQELPAKTAKDCRQACAKDPHCETASFKEKRCEQLSGVFATEAELEAATMKDDKATLFHKICLDKDACENEYDFERMPQRILTGFMEKVLSVPSSDACIQACVQIRGFQCRSVQFYPSAKAANCILNSQNRHSFPKVFGREWEDPVDYVEVNCSSPSSFRRSPKNNADSRSNARRRDCDVKSIRYMETEGFEIDPYPDGESVEAKSVEECRKLCSLNPVCRSASFNSKDGSCLISSAIHAPIVENFNATTFNRICLNSRPAKICPGKVKRVPQYRLSGLAAELLGRATLEDCMERCMLAETDYGYSCRSLMFYSETPAPNCILNLRTADEVGGTEMVFAPDKERTVDYIEFDCEDSEKVLRDENNSATLRGNNIAPEQIIKPQPNTKLCNPALSRYAIVDGHSMSLPMGGYKAENQSMCLRDCTFDLHCQAVLYDAKIDSCVTINSHIGREYLQPQVGSQYFEKICLEGVRADLSKCSAFFRKQPRYHLLGFEEAVVETESLEECLRECVDAVFIHGFVCRSGMWEEAEEGKKKGECILNTVDRNMQPDLYFPSPVYPRDYFEFSCLTDQLEVGSIIQDLETHARYQ